MKVLLGTLFLALAAVTRQDPPKKAESPDDFLKRVEEKHAKAKALRWKGTTSLDMKEMQGTFQVDLLVKGNQVRVVMEGKLSGLPMKSTIICDGNKVWNHSSIQGGDSVTTDAPKDAGALLRVDVIRLGLMGATGRLTGSHEKSKEMGPGIKGLAFGPDEKIAGRTVRLLKIESKDPGDDPSSLKLWIDSETLTLVKREIVDEHEQAITEACSETSFDPEIPADTFTIPR